MGLSKWNEYIIVIIQEYMNSETESESKITTEFCWGYFYIIKKKKKKMRFENLSFNTFYYFIFWTRMKKIIVNAVKPAFVTI
jgi:hypothetical protein